MAFLWILPLAMSHRHRHVGDGQCSYLPTETVCEVSANGATLPTSPWQNAGYLVDVTALSPGATLTVNVRPQGATANKYWPISCNIDFAPDQRWSISQDPSAACTISTIGVPPQSLTILCVFLSRLRNVTARVAELLETLPTPRSEDLATRQTWSPLWQNPLPSRGSLNYVNTNRPADTALSFARADVTPDGENLLFEVCGTGSAGPIVPRLLSVYWPRWVQRRIATTQPGTTMWPIADPTSYFIYYHSSTGQNQNAGYYLGSYPESFDYLHYIHWADHNYTTDPLAWALKGIPYQMARSRVHAVSVIPCLNSRDEETGQYNNADFLVESLEELQASMLRQNGIFFCQPTVGRVALGGFSAGTQLVANTIGRIRRHPFASRGLKEVYMFDPNIDNADVLGERVATAEDFLLTGDASDRGDKQARIYTQVSTAAARTRLQRFLGRNAPSLAGPISTVSIVDSTDGNRTAAILPPSAWPDLDADGNPVPGGRSGQEVHQLIPAMMLTDALNRSGFIKEP